MPNQPMAILALLALPLFLCQVLLQEVYGIYKPPAEIPRQKLNSSYALSYLLQDIAVYDRHMAIKNNKSEIMGWYY